MGVGWIWIWIWIWMDLDTGKDWMDLDVCFPFLSSNKELEARIAWFGQLDGTFTHDRQTGNA